jgi:hypothetical protein
MGEKKGKENLAQNESVMIMLLKVNEIEEKMMMNDGDENGNTANRKIQNRPLFKVNGK